MAALVAVTAATPDPGTAGDAVRESESGEQDSAGTARDHLDRAPPGCVTGPNASESIEAIAIHTLASRKSNCRRTVKRKRRDPDLMVVAHQHPTPWPTNVKRHG
jgi:hypothetical protein